MRYPPIVSTLAAVALLTLRSSAPLDPPPPTRVDVAPGIYLFQTAPYSDVGLDGNAVAIVGDDGVLVFDANGTPSAAAAVLRAIRAMTPKPVKYLVLSHWHWDHWYGAQVYRTAFPDIEIIAHERTKALMAGPAIAFNQPGIDEQLPAHIAAVAAALAKRRSAAAAAALAGDTTIARLEQHLAADESFLREKKSVTPTLPTRTIRDSLVLHLGSRTIVVHHHDRAITPGDVYLWLPKERIAVTGDLLINPITFALLCYPSGWLRTLHHLDSLNANVLIPGHGDPLRDGALLHATIALLEREQTLAIAEKRLGHSAEDASTAILKDSAVLTLRARITGGNTARNDAFKLYLVDWFVARVYQEQDGTLDDSLPRLSGDAT